MTRALVAVAPLALLVLSAACSDNGGGSTVPTATPPIETTATAAAAATATVEPTVSLQSEVGAEATWEMPEGALTELLACDLQRLSCVTDIMEAGGASQAAIDFFVATRWFLTGFQELGVVDLAEVLIPWRANSNDDYALVNGSPSFVLAEDAGGQLVPDETNEAWTALRDVYDQLLIWPSDAVYESLESSPSGGEAAVFQYPLNDGCHACGTPYAWRVALDFTPDGAYEGTRLLDICARAPADPSTVVAGVASCPPIA